MSAGGEKHAGSTAFDMQAAIRALRQEQGTQAQAETLSRNLADRLGPAALDRLVAPAAPTGLPWPVCAGLVGGALATVAALLATPAARPEPAENAPLEVAGPGPANVPSLPSAAPSPARPADADQPAAFELPHEQPNAQVAPLETSPRPRARRTRPRLGELALLRRSRAALRSDPSKALALAEEHARDYPRGVFMQEREVLAIQALLRQRRRTEAFKRAERFLARRPESPYALRIRAMLEQMPNAREDAAD